MLDLTRPVQSTPTAGRVGPRVRLAIRLAMACAALGIASEASAQTAPIAVVLCVDGGDVERDAVSKLSAWVRTAALRATDLDDCDAADRSAYVGRFARRGTVVEFVLQSPEGDRLSRHVPWLLTDERALSSLAIDARLSAFAVMIDGLVIEDRLARAEVPPLPPVLVRRRRTAVTDPIAPSPAPIEPPPAPRVLPQPPPAPLVPEPIPAPEPAASTAVARRPRPVVDPLPARLDIALAAGAHWRAPTSIGVEIALAGRWHDLIAELAWQPPFNWRWDRRRLRSDAWGGGIGWSPRLIDTGDWRLGVRALAVAERVTVRRVDVEPASQRGIWDAGAAAGAIIERRAAAAAVIALLADLRWQPTGRRLVVPDGPSEIWNRWGARIMIELRSDLR